MTDEELEVTGHEDECDCGCEDEDLIDLVDDSGRHLKFFHVGSTEFKEKWYACFMPAEEIEGLGEDEVVIFEVKKNEETGAEDLLPVKDQVVLEAVFEQFCKEMEEAADAAEAEELECGCHSHHHHGCGCGCEDEEEESDDCGCGCGCNHKN